MATEVEPYDFVKLHASTSQSWLVKTSPTPHRLPQNFQYAQRWKVIVWGTTFEGSLKHQPHCNVCPVFRCVREVWGYYIQEEEASADMGRNVSLMMTTTELVLQSDSRWYDADAVMRTVKVFHCDSSKSIVPSELGNLLIFHQLNLHHNIRLTDNFQYQNVPFRDQVCVLPHDLCCVAEWVCWKLSIADFHHFHVNGMLCRTSRRLTCLTINV